MATDTLTGSDVVGLFSAGAPALGQSHVLTATGISSGSPTVGSPLANSALAPISISTGAPTVGTPTIGIDQVFQLIATALVLGTPAVGSPSLAAAAALPVYPKPIVVTGDARSTVITGRQ